MVNDYFIPTYCILPKKCVVKEISISKRWIRNLHHADGRLRRGAVDALAFHAVHEMAAEALLTVLVGVWIVQHVFIIRKDIEKEFKEVIGDRIASICASHGVTVDYAFQNINDIPGTLPEGRTKPWGTGQAVLAAKKVLDTPFIVINADDYYGKEGFKAVHEYLVNGGKSCMAGFVLKNTLSDNGGVTRGVCKMDENGNLTEVVETKNIVKTATGAEADGVAVDVNSLVSMNMWGLTPEFLDVLEKGFKEFFEKEVPGNPLKAEYLIPIFIGELLEQGKMSVKVLKTNDTWYGMTYHADVAAVKDSFKKMLENGVYKCQT